MNKNRRSFLKATAALGTVSLVGFPHIWSKNASLARAADGQIKVGVLFSLTGTTAIIEESLNKATILAIEEINAAGGINGMQIVPVVEDPASDPATFAEKARNAELWDVEGRRYIDFAAGIGVLGALGIEAWYRIARRRGLVSDRE